MHIDSEMAGKKHFLFQVICLSFTKQKGESSKILIIQIHKCNIPISCNIFCSRKSDSKKLLSQ